MTFTDPSGQRSPATNLFGQDQWARRGEAQAAAASVALPVGVINAYYGTVAPAGWLLCDGSAIPAAYPTLIALVGANTPNLKGKVIVGVDAAQAEFVSLGTTGGAKTQILASGNQPVHTHAIDHTHGAFTSGGGSSHDHGLTNHNHGGGTGVHAHGVTAGLGGGNIGLTAGGNNYNLLEQSKTTDSQGVANSTQGSADTAHTHSTTVSALTSSSGNGAFANTPVATLQPYAALNWIIKAS